MHAHAIVGWLIAKKSGCSYRLFNTEFFQTNMGLIGVFPLLSCDIQQNLWFNTKHDTFNKKVVFISTYLKRLTYISPYGVMKHKSYWNGFFMIKLSHILFFESARTFKQIIGIPTQTITLYFHIFYGHCSKFDISHLRTVLHKVSFKKAAQSLNKELRWNWLL